MSTTDFNVMRSDGTDTRRAALTVNWERPFSGRLGDQWKLSLHGDATAYDASQFDLQPNFGPYPNVTAVRALPQAAVIVSRPAAQTIVNFNLPDGATKRAEFVGAIVGCSTNSAFLSFGSPHWLIVISNSRFVS